MRAVATWFVGAIGLLLLLLVLGPFATGGGAATPRSDGLARTAQGAAGVKKLYTLTVTYTAEQVWEAYAGDRLGGEIERTTTWIAKSVKPFVIERRGTRARPAYHFVARVAGRLRHEGEGWIGLGGVNIVCQLYGTDSSPQQGSMLRGTIETLKSVPRGKYALLIRPTRRKLKVVFTTEATDCGPQVVPSARIDMSWGLMPPGVWNDRKYFELGGQPHRALRFGRAFTIKRLADELVDPSLRRKTVTGMGSTVIDTTLKWTLTFKPVRGR